MKWKVGIVGSTGTVYKDTDAFRLLYPFPTRQAAEEHAECLRTVGVKVALSDGRGISQTVVSTVAEKTRKHLTRPHNTQ